MRIEWETAARLGDASSLAEQLEDGADVDGLDRYGQSALMIAAVRGHVEAVRVLIDAGAELNRTAKFGLSATMLAVVNRHEDVARLLASAGADLGLRGGGAPGFAGKSASDLAREMGMQSLADRLQPSGDLAGPSAETEAQEMRHDPTEVPKSGAPAVLEALARAPDVIIPLVQSAHPDVLKRRPEAGRWSIHEHACHLATVHPMISGRLDKMLQLDDPVIASYDPARSGTPIELVEMDLEDSLRRFRSDRGALVDRLLELDPSDWSRTARHEEYNAYSVLIMIRHLSLHDFFHAYRIEELVLQRGWPNAPQLAS